MRRIIKTSIAFVALVSVGMTVVSCNNESVDPLLEDGKEVGKALVYTNTDGTEQIFRENVVAKISANGEMDIPINGIKGEKNDVLNLHTRIFQEGNFPGNANKSTYFDRENNQYFSTVDPDRPTYITGFMKVEFINRKARVVSGSYDLRMIPVKVEGEDTDPSIRSFQVKGTFENVPYERAEATYVDAEIDGATYRNTVAQLAKTETTYVVNSMEKNNEEQRLTFSFPIEKAVAGQVIKMDEDGVDAFYSSGFGIKYILDKEDEELLSKTYIKIESVDTIVEQVNGTPVEKVTIKGQFYMKLKGEAESKRIIEVKYGVFKVTQ
ncbi:hypothetical protein [Myroides pelagicus]|uniref:Uncharacterized protein n=1 Tax=Myroides pelagicus TaxID=270914 RepID=A0A7K1GMV6_9FLAO|nr:hypothetical protein [Myroides pelagicus]MEC4114538.1 hypothetical protein [Myroides pelagicus]MTH30161.1 hypothetical protein [Myroides pelagicus]